jgi:hypothetical protein
VIVSNGDESVTIHRRERIPDNSDCDTSRCYHSSTTGGNILSFAVSLVATPTGSRPGFLGGKGLKIDCSRSLLGKIVEVDSGLLWRQSTARRENR